MEKTDLGKLFDIFLILKLKHNLTEIDSSLNLLI